MTHFPAKSISLVLYKFTTDMAFISLSTKLVEAFLLSSSSLNFTLGFEESMIGSLSDEDFTNP